MSPTTLILGLFLSLLVAGLPTVFWAALVWWCDRYEREPIRLVTAAFLWGALPAVVLALALEAWLGVPFAGLSLDST
jgi:RsiW-degrading membrane proteinase PrsW (M82 family)